MAEKRKETEIEWYLKYILLFVLLAAALSAAINFPRLRMYQNYFFRDSPQVTMRYEQLSPGMDEAAVRRHFDGVPLNCVAEGGSLGDRVCYAAVEAVDGEPALGIALFFKHARLRHTVIQVPWWRHLRQKNRLIATYGPPRLREDPDGTTLLAWYLPHGDLVFNRDRTRDLDPLAWSVVMWTAGEMLRR